MTLNTFEGGTPAATITTGNSGGASGDAFNFVQIAATGTATYVADAYRGAVAGRFASGGTAGIVYAEYTSSVDVAGAGKVYGRARFKLPVLPGDSTGTRVAVIADGTGTFRLAIHIINTGKIQLRGSAGTTLATSAMTYVAGTWVDIGWAILNLSTTVGVIECKIFDAAGAVTETLTSAANQNTTGSGGVYKLQTGQVRSQTSFVVQVDDLGFDLTGYPVLPNVSPPPTVTFGPWSGAVTDDGFTVGYVLADTASARLVVSTSVGLTSPVYSAAAAPDSDGMVQLTIAGLAADTLYYYGVEADGGLLAGDQGQARTMPAEGVPASFSVAFGSCQFDVPSDSTFAAIAARSGPFGRVRQIVHMGDMNYRDWDGTATQADVFDQHMTSLGSASMAAPLALVPLNYVWDNHDWGGDNSDSTAAAGNIVAATYRQVFPHYPLPATNGRGVYHSWVIGRVRFIQLDVRSYRDPQSDPDGPGKTMLGAEQKAWFAARLADPEPVKIVCANYPWRTGVVGDGRYGSYATEFNDLNATMASVAGGRVFVIFGDRHFLAADDGSSADTRGVPQAGGAPFQQASVATGGPWSQGAYTTTPAVLQAYGVLDIDDQGDTIVVEYEGITSLDGVTRVSMMTEFAVEITGGGDQLLPAVQAAGAGAVSLTGGGDVELPAATIAGAGTVSLAGGGDLGLPAALLAGQGAVAATGGGALLLPPVNASGSGTVSLTGAGDLGLPAALVDGAGGQTGPQVPITGGGDLGLPALTVEGMGEIVAACETWPYDTSCLPDGWPDNPADMSVGQRSAYDFAVELLGGLSLGEYGLCTLIVRPCGVGCAIESGFRMMAGGWFGPSLRSGQVYNGCGCASSCGCAVASEVLLAGPVYDIVQVKIDGEVVDPDTYRVDDGFRLVRVDGLLWPMTQDLNASAGRPGTFEVTYRRGQPLPAGGRRALSALMVELFKAGCGDQTCRLPSRVTNIVREGVTYSMLDDPTALLDAGRLGIPEVDMWLALVNRNGSRTRMKVYSPDTAGRTRRQTWPVQ